MAAPSISGITRLKALTPGTIWSLTAVGGATLPFSSAATATSDLEGEGNTVSVTALNITAGGSAADVFSAFTVLDSTLNLNTHLFVTHISTPSNLRAGGIKLALFSGETTAEYRIYNLPTDSTLPITAFNLICLDNVSYASQTAGFNPADVKRYGVIAKRSDTGGVNIQFRHYQALAVSKTAYQYLGGEVGTPATLADFYEKSRPISANTTGSLLIRKQRDFFYSSYLPEFNNDYFVIQARTVEVVEDLLGVVATNGTKRLVINSPSFAINNSLIKTSAPTTPTQISGNGVLESALFLGNGTFSATENGALAFRGGTIESKNTVTINGGDYSNLSLNAFPAGATLTLNTSVMQGTAALVSALTFSRPPGDHADLRLELGAGQILNITQGSGIYTLTGLTGGTVGNPVVFDNTGGGAAVVVVSAEINAVAKSPITSGTLTLQTPVSQIVLSNIPQVAGAIVGVINLSTMAQSFPNIASGVANIPTDPATNYLIAVDAPGWVRQQIILSGATPGFTLDWTNRDYRDLYEMGDPTYEGIDLNYSTFGVTVDQSLLLIDPATAFRRIEDLLANQQAIFFPNPPFPQVVELSELVAEYYLVFPYDEANNVVNPVVIRPHPSNTLDVSLVGFSILLKGAPDPFYDIFDFTQQPNGRIIRINTKSTFVQNVVSGGLSTADRAVIDAIGLATVDLPALIEDSGGKRFKAKALETAPAPSGGGGGLGPENIERLERIEQQLIADVVKGRDRYQRLLPGTSTVILDQDVAYHPETGFTLTEHQEPPP